MSLIDRNLFSPHVILDEEYEDDYHLHDSNRDSDLAHQISPQELENINQIRKLIRDQSFLGFNSSKTNIVRSRNEYPESLDDLEVPVRRFTPLPGIPRFEDPYYRTESQLIKHEIDNDDIPMNSTYSSLKRSLTMNESKYSYLFEADNYYNDTVKSKNQLMFTRGEAQKINHFSSVKSNAHKKCVHRLPALEKSINHSLQNTMDLDEDLPMNPVNETINRRGVYTSPGERLVSPVKRPQAPSPASSEYRRTNADPRSPDLIPCYINGEV